MRLQYKYSEYKCFQWTVKLYHDGKLIKSYRVCVNELSDEIESLEAAGYTYGYTAEECEEAKAMCERMLRNIIKEI